MSHKQDMYINSDEIVNDDIKLEDYQIRNKILSDKDATESNASEEITTNKLKPAVSSTGVYNMEIYAKYYANPFQKFLIYFSLFVIYYAYGLDGNVRPTYQTLATSSFNRHSLNSTVTCINRVTSSAGQIWFARASDIFSREFSMVISILFYVVGTIISSQATSVAKYAVGACIYGIGHAGIVLLCEIYMADFSNLNWRVVAENAPMLPAIINTWVSGNITSDLGSKWQWGLGMWAIIFPASCIPLFVCIYHMRYMAKKNNEKIRKIFEKPSEIAWKKYLIDIFIWKLDFIGLVLLVAVFALILVPFTTSGGLHREWNSANFIVPEVVGWVVALPIFSVWEWKFSRYPILRLDLISDRGIYSALSISFFIQFCLYVNDTYLYTFLLVAVDQTTKSGTRINSLMSFVNVITACCLGLFIVKIRRTQIFIVIGCVSWFVVYGLYVHYNGGLGSRSGIITASCLSGFGYGFIKSPLKASLQASSNSHQNLAIVTALFLAIGNIGTAFGAAVAGAIWSNLLPHRLEKSIGNVTLADSAFDSPIKFIKQYKWHTAVRQHLVSSYGSVWRILNIVCLVLVIPMLVSSFLLRDRKLSNSVAYDQRDFSPTDCEEENIGQDRRSYIGDRYAKFRVLRERIFK
ncbi:hypothetical protein TPHA_0B00180 [Tetrapisispora phaffii CBS 4417]|uniref:Major facilitator superfamily (MFS) profile domain-containing protein n=1 Tax=Tetrapisispora phaffii (strain ATCC 24235 / CBS 4417 / NBRC 1672 / NRRL Y-8282 / UCD 70-5) TaxID=1071381 RepID=G8BQ93_TETPH|nr:hypothetical protein TPHA_0B00180 [Tetrapisispora phaffii CBS 4417]CCE61690.1 hypothetical protein TPHA_0B00180 [Tetrapisispora phaffii CBS 4417]